MTKRIIDNKTIDLTDTEFQLYQEIASSYNTPQFDGKNLFKGLFETNDAGQITMLRPPNKNQSSLEVYLYLLTVFNHQQLRHSANVVDTLVAEMKAELAGIKKERAELQELIEKNKV